MYYQVRSLFVSPCIRNCRKRWGTTNSIYSIPQSGGISLLPRIGFVCIQPVLTQKSNSEAAAQRLGETSPWMQLFYLWIQWQSVSREPFKNTGVFILSSLFSQVHFNVPLLHVLQVGWGEGKSIKDRILFPPPPSATLVRWLLVQHSLITFFPLCRSVSAIPTTPEKHAS